MDLTFLLPVSIDRATDSQKNTALEIKAFNFLRSLPLFTKTKQNLFGKTAYISYVEQMDFPFVHITYR
jgi:hypothetical protein